MEERRTEWIIGNIDFHRLVVLLHQFNPSFDTVLRSISVCHDQLESMSDSTIVWSAFFTHTWYHHLLYISFFHVVFDAAYLCTKSVEALPF